MINCLEPFPIKFARNREVMLEVLNFTYMRLGAAEKGPLPRAKTELRCIALELNDGGGNGLVYPLRLIVSCSWVEGGDWDNDDRRGGISFGGNGGGDDISTPLSLYAG